MSSSVSPEEDQQLFIGICCSISATAFLVYEYLVTFDREYQHVWKRPFSAATLVFLLARYPIILAYIFDLPTIYLLSTRSCSAFTWLPIALELCFSFLVPALSSLRVYALSGRRWPIASLVFILSLVPVGIALFADMRQVVVVAPPPINCAKAYLVSSKLANILTYVAHATSVTADVLVLAVTVYQTSWRRRGAAEANLRTPLHTLILRDGTIYFLVLLILNITDIVLIYLGETLGSYSYISQFIDPIAAVIISRFMLNLREVDVSQRGTEDPSRPSFVGSIQLAAFVEPLGAPLEHELSFSAIDPGSLNKQGVGAECDHEDVLVHDEEMMSGQISIRGDTKAEPGPSGVRV